MSSYINFFIRHKDEFIPIYDSSRSTYIYKVFQNKVPYEKIKAIKKIDFEKVYCELQDTYHTTKENIEKQKDFIKTVSGFNNSIDEKIEIIDRIKEDCDEMEGELDWILSFMAKIDFMISMIEVIEYSEENYKIDIDNYIYAGIEIAYPTIKDIAN